MKRLLIVLVVVVMLGGVGGNVFAQNLPGVAPEGDNPKNAVGIDLGTLFGSLIAGGFGIGGSYERELIPILSIKVTGSFASFPLYGSLVSATGAARWYFLKTSLNGPYVSAGGGVGIMLTGGTAVMPIIYGEGGYKFTVMNGGESGFFVEPFVGFSYQPFNISGPGMVNLGGFSFGANLGWSF
ncbi:MAG: hypothetical protein ACLFRY_12645 [Spirochaetia bacterium]